MGGERCARAKASSAIPPVVQHALGSPWHRLDATVLAAMESKLGHDFGRVRVHDDDTAASAARAVGARAYTVGADVVFGRGEYAPHAPEGRRVLEHELTHVVQQAGVRDPRTVSFTMGPVGGALEAEAARGRPLGSRMEAPVVQRQPITPPAAADTKADETRTALLAGSFTNAGTFTYDGKGNEGFHFSDRALDRLLHHHIEGWAPTVKLLRRPVGVSAGDSEGKAVNAVPPWVNDFQERLIGQRPRGAKSPSWEDTSPPSSRSRERPTGRPSRRPRSAPSTTSREMRPVSRRARARCGSSR